MVVPHEWLARIESKLDTLLRLEIIMAVDQAAFDTALAAFLVDIDAAVQAIQAKAPAVDLSVELASITDAKDKLDTALAAAPAAPVAPVAPDVPPVDPNAPPVDPNAPPA